MSKARDIANYGLGVGISSAGVSIASSIRTLDFVGAGNTFSYDVVSNSVDISIAGGGGTKAGSQINYPDGTKSPFMLSSTHINKNMVIDNTSTGETIDCNVVVAESQMIIDTGIGLTIGSGKKVLPDLYDIFS